MRDPSANDDKRFRALFDNNAAAIGVLDDKGCFSLVNATWTKFFGYEPEEVLGKSPALVTHPDDVTESGKYLEQIISGKIKAYRIEKRFVRKDGKIVWGDLSVTAIYDDTGGLLEIVGVILDVSNRKRAEAELIEAKKIAEKANQDKSRFLAAVSHDLRQPLQAMNLFLASLANLLSQDDERRILELACQSADAVSEMLDELMEIARFDAMKTPPQLRSVSLQPLLLQCSNEMRAVAEEKGLRLRLRTPRKIRVLSDPVLLKRMVRNLLSNAVRYTERGGVLLSVRQREGTARIEVRDTGVGIADKDLACIFDEFYRIGQPGRDKGAGLGLGLAIVQRAAVMLGHDLDVASRPGKGSCFSVSVPVCASGVGPKKVTGAEMQTDFADMFVLVVDDDHIILRAMHELLSGWGCQFLLADSIDDLHEKLLTSNRGAADLLISDYRLRDGCTGLDVVAMVRKHFRSDDLPAIILSGDLAPEVRIAVRRAGCEWMEKPVTSQSLRSVLSRMVGSRRQHESVREIRP